MYPIMPHIVGVYYKMIVYQGHYLFYQDKKAVGFGASPLPAASIIVKYCIATTRQN